MTDELAADLEEAIDAELDVILDYARRKNVERQRKEYAADPLFHRFNLDSRKLVLAKVRAGLVTSIHRKVGDLIEKHVQQVFRERMGLEAVTYDAEIVVDGESKTRELDARLLLDEVADGPPTERLQRVLDDVEFGENKRLSEFTDDGVEWRGMGFEIRHCYQSADSKRSQADIAMAQHLKNEDVVPVMLIFCGDSNESVTTRYRNHMVVTEGEDSFELVEQLTGFDYAGFLDGREDVIDAKIGQAFDMF